MATHVIASATSIACKMGTIMIKCCMWSHHARRDHPFPTEDYLKNYGLRVFNSLIALRRAITGLNAAKINFPRIDDNFVFLDAIVELYGLLTILQQELYSLYNMVKGQDHYKLWEFTVSQGTTQKLFPKN